MLNGTTPMPISGSVCPTEAGARRFVSARYSVGLMGGIWTSTRQCLRSCVLEQWDIAIAEVGAGNYPAAAIAERAIQYFDPEVALFVGVAGGIKDVVIGDVVVASKVYGYERGREDQEGFKVRGDIQSAAHGLEQRARSTRLKSAWKNRLDPTFSCGQSRIHVGPIAAGEKVLASTRGPIATFLCAHYSDALAVEMEGRGFLEGVHINPSVQGCVIRGISDLLDRKSHTDATGSQERAADAAAAVALEILLGLDSGPAGQIGHETHATNQSSRVPLCWPKQPGQCTITGRPS
jgi:nucleoside phosphorylase